LINWLSFLELLGDGPGPEREPLVVGKSRLFYRLNTLHVIQLTLSNTEGNGMEGMLHKTLKSLQKVHLSHTMKF